MNICQIANQKAGGEKGAKTAQSTYLSCHDTIRTQILIWSSNCEVEMPGFAGKTGPIPTVRVFRVVKPVAKVRVRVEPDPEPTRAFGTVANTT